MIHLFTHNDLDGIGCAIIAKLTFQKKVEVHYNSVGSLNIQVEKFIEAGNIEHKLMITDLSVNERNEALITTFIENGGNAILIDHHKSALHLNEHSWGNVTVEYEDGRLTSATSLLFDYLKEEGEITTNKAIEDFVELVRQYDTWEWDANGNTEAKRLNDLFYMLSIDEFVDRMLPRLERNEPFQFDDFESQILDLEENKMERYLRRKQRELIQTNIDGKIVGVVFAESYISELGNEFGKHNTHLDYIAIVNMGSRRISLRTVHDEIDVSLIASQFDGGGHSKAAGCLLTDKAYTLFVSNTFKLEPIKMDAFNNVYNVKESRNGSLYRTKENGLFFIINANGTWKLVHEGKPLEEKFSTYIEAERHLKRTFGAWLVRDREYVDYLMEHANPLKK
ncbi:oligoribonuclease [Sutcliffiella cohnii]|uniref:Oligoribonuclease n=1 Tax=Sutcliffiella cohnii TaxID=33932 RepID=A0A223KQT5_9BACI|nr:DHH family phosphoesterase [Sutcliffiella cohnii]AST91832.1 oligoribonuclease [Sutcliffiella cohnii]